LSWNGVVEEIVAGHDRDRRAARVVTSAKPTQKFKTINTGHTEIHNNRVGTARFDCTQSILCAECRLDLIAFEPQYADVCPEPAGYQVLRANNGPIVIALLATGTPFDLLIADLDMPDMNGAEMVRRIRTTRPDLKVLYVTAYIDSLMDTRPLWRLQGWPRSLHQPETPRACRAHLQQPRDRAGRLLRRLSYGCSGATKTKMSDEPFHSPKAKPVPRQAQPSARLLVVG
jgi:CheY-like chemotaxis protein